MLPYSVNTWRETAIASGGRFKHEATVVRMRGPPGWIAQERIWETVTPCGMSQAANHEGRCWAMRSGTRGESVISKP